MVTESSEEEDDERLGNYMTRHDTSHELEESVRTESEPQIRSHGDCHHYELHLGRNKR